ncbi:MAG: helix-turn-helix domain-containing protein, partial [Candidatus Aenigmarchaeota archaeon]|nr:helix-turn-helix domain-containing protein [Candidatus Aenigmarchaeota archaeon]
ENILECIYLVLKNRGYKVFTSSSYSFDIFASKGNKSFVIKVYLNVDSLEKQIADDLIKISKVFDAVPIVISFGDSRITFSDNMIYFRFGIVVVTPSTFISIIKGNLSFDSYVYKGRRLCYIDTNKLKELRISKGYSLTTLADAIGISKKCLYEIEKGINKPSLRTVIKIEKILGDNIRKTVDIKEISRNISSIILKEKIGLIKRLVLEKYKMLKAIAFNLHKSPFDIVAKHKAKIITHIIETREEHVMKNIVISEKFSKCVNIRGIIVSKRPIGVDSMFPMVTIDEIKKAKNFEDIVELSQK